MSVYPHYFHLAKHTNYSPLWTFIIFCLSLSFSEAQTDQLDSMKALLPQVTAPEERYKLLDEITWQSKDDFPEQTITYARQMLLLDNPEWQSTAYTRLATAEFVMRNLDQALSYYDSSLQIEKNLGRFYGLGRAENEKARIYIEKFDFMQAREHASKAVHYLKQDQSKHALATALGVLGYIYTDLMAFDSSIYYLSKSQELSSSIGYYPEAYRSQLNFSRLYLRMNNFDRCIDYGEQAISFINSNNLDNKLLGQVYTNVGEAYYKTWDLKKAEEYQLMALAINNQAQNFKWASLNLNNLGNIYLANRQFEKSEAYHLQSKGLKRKEGFLDEFISDINLGNLYLDLNQPQKALSSFQDALRQAESLDRLRAFPEVLRGLSRSNYQLGNSKEAITYQNRFIQIKEQAEMDRIRAVNLEKELQDEKSLTARLRLEGEKQNLRQEKQQLTILALAGAMVLVVILFFVIIKLSQLRNRNRLIKKNEQIQQQQIEQLIKQKEVDAMSAMLEGQESERLRIARDLHDRLGGTLSIVKVHFKSVEESLEALKETTIQQYRDANTLLDEACDEVRKIAHDMTSGVLMKFGLVTALEELKATVDATHQLKINLIDIGLDERLTYDYEINVYRIIQELITNALKHARASEMTIQLFRKDNRLSIVVEDNGQGFVPKEAEKKGGIGLKNIEGRTNKLEGELSIDSGLGSGTTITIDIPIKEESV